MQLAVTAATRWACLMIITTGLLLYDRLQLTACMQAFRGIWRMHQGNQGPDSCQLSYSLFVRPQVGARAHMFMRTCTDVCHLHRLLADVSAIILVFAALYTAVPHARFDLQIWLPVRLIQSRIEGEVKNNLAAVRNHSEGLCRERNARKSARQI